MIVKHKGFFCYIILLTLIAGLLLLPARQAKTAQHSLPVHHISVEFNLQENALRARSRIELPAEQDLRLDLSLLNVSEILVNGQPRTADEENPFLDIVAVSEDQQILITYGMKFPPDWAPFSMISETGITLTDRWHPVSDREMLFKLTAHVPLDFEAISEADEIVSFDINNSKQVTFLFPHPLPAINFVAGPYQVTEENFGEGKIISAYFFPEDQHLAEQYLDKTKRYLERYEAMIGPYPYKRFSVVENRLPTGFAMPTFTLLGQSVVRLPFIVDTSLGHEVLHAWFGNGVRLSPDEGNWVEGLTTYLADHAFAADRGQGKSYRKEQLTKYQSYVRPGMDIRLRDFSNFSGENSGSKTNRAVGYNKSSMFFHMLRNRVGPDFFKDSLRHFYEKFKYGTASWSDLQASFEAVSSLELDGFFSQWLDRGDIPAIAVKRAEVDNSRGHPVANLEIIQKNTEPFELELEVVIRGPAEEITETVSLTEHSTSVEIPLETLPDTLVVDPDHDIMRVLDQSELPPTWSRFLGAADKAAILASEDDREKFAALLPALEENDVRILLQEEVSDQDLADGSFLLFNPQGRQGRAIFAGTDHPASGFTLDVRENPLNRNGVVVLVSAEDAEEVNLVQSKLRHYGKYSYLHFQDGRIREKQIAEADLGLQIELVRLPSGIETSRVRTFSDIIDRLKFYQVVYVGEDHTRYEDHQLQLEVVRALFEHDPNLAIGMEMFTRPSQEALDSYIAGETDEKSFLKESHYFNIWRYDYRLYRDIINFARHNKLPVIALNLEKEIVSQVFRNGGPNSLTEEEIELLPEDRKLDMDGYGDRIEFAYRMHAGQQQGEFSGFIQAQAIWDETMAQAIADYLQAHPDKRMVVIAGRGHVDKINAIPPRVRRRLPVSQTVLVNSRGPGSNPEAADFIFSSPPVTLPPFPLLGVMIEDTEGEEGILVTALNPKGQAKEAGIREKDIILAIDGEPVNDIEDLKITMLYKVESDSVLVTIQRPRFLFGKNTMEMEVQLKSPGKSHHMK